MSLKVEGRRLGDWLKDERPSGGSRGLATVLSGQTLKAGQVCTTDSAGKRKVIAATGNEVHTYTFTGTPTAGTFTLTVWHKDGYWVTTAALSYAATTAQVDAALEAVLGTSSVTAVATGSGSAITVITITFGGTGYTNIVQPLGTCNWQGVTGWTACAVTRSTSAGAAQNEVQTVTLSGAMTAGTYQGTIFMPDNVPLTFDVAWNTDWTTTMADINTAITAAATAWYGGASVGAVMTGTATAQVLTFSGVGCTGLAIPKLAEIDTQGITGATSASVARTTAGGTSGNRVGALADSISVAAVDASAGDVTNCQFIERDAVVDSDQLYYGGADPTATATALKALGIIARSEAANRAVAV